MLVCNCNENCFMYTKNFYNNSLNTIETCEIYKCNRIVGDYNKKTPCDFFKKLTIKEILCTNCDEQSLSKIVFYLCFFVVIYNNLSLYKPLFLLIYFVLFYFSFQQFFILFYTI